MGEVKITNFTISDNSIMELICKECGTTSYAMYITILSFRNQLTGECFPSYTTIGERIGLSKESVKKTITKLHKSGYILINSGRQGVNNNYYFPKEQWYKNEGCIATRRNPMEKRSLGK